MDVVKQKRRPFQPKEEGTKNSAFQLSSGSESAIGEPEIVPKITRQHSNTEGTPPSQADLVEGSEKSDTSQLSVMGSNHPKVHAETRGNVSKVEEGGRQSEVTASTRTYSESSSNVTQTMLPNHSQVEILSKTHASPPTATTVAPPPGLTEGEERQSSKSKPQTVGSSAQGQPNSSEPSKVATVVMPTVTLDHRPETATPEVGQVVGSSEETCTTAPSSTVWPSDLPTPINHTQMSLEASSSSLSQDPPPLSLPGTGSEKSNSDKSTTDKLQANERQGNGKKKTSRGKPRQLKLVFQELTNENVVKCTLNTSTGQVDFRFSMKYDKPVTIFKKFVSFTFY